MLVDAGSARLSLWQNGRKIDQMKIVVGKAETATPMMAAYIKYASVNPYWNVPPELVRNLIGPRIVAQGISYLTDREYQVLTGLRRRCSDSRSVNGRLAGGRRRPPRCRAATSSQPCQFHGCDEVHAPQLLRHLPPRFAGDANTSRRMSSGSVTAACDLKTISALPSFSSTAASLRATTQRLKRKSICLGRFRST